MKNENLNNALSNLDISFIENHLKEKEKYARKRKFKAMLVRFGATAACVAFIVTSVIVPIRLSNIPSAPIGTSGSQQLTDTTQTTDPNHGQEPDLPKYEDSLYTAEEIANLLNNTKGSGGMTNDYRTVWVSEAKYLNINPIPNRETLFIYRVEEGDVPIDEEEAMRSMDNIFLNIARKYDANASVPYYSIKSNSSGNMLEAVSSYVQNSAKIYYSSRWAWVKLKPSGDTLFGNPTRFDIGLSYDEIIELVEPLKYELGDIFDVNFNDIIINNMLSPYGKMYVYFYNKASHELNDYGLYNRDIRPYSDYIELFFEAVNEQNVHTSSGNRTWKLKEVNYWEFRSGANQIYSKIAKGEMISLEEAEELLYKGYGFGAYSNKDLQTEISFENYDYVSMEYLFGYLSDERTDLVGMPFYVFYKKMTDNSGDGGTYAKVYVSAFKVEGLEDYFIDSTGHK